MFLSRDDFSGIVDMSMASADESGSRRQDPIKFEAGDKSKPSEHSERRKPTDTKFSDAPDGASKEAKRPSVFDRLQSKVCGGPRLFAVQDAATFFFVLHGASSMGVGQTLQILRHCPSRPGAASAMAVAENSFQRAGTD